MSFDAIRFASDICLLFVRSFDFLRVSIFVCVFLWLSPILFHFLRFPYLSHFLQSLLRSLLVFFDSSISPSFATSRIVQGPGVNDRWFFIISFDLLQLPSFPHFFCRFLFHHVDYHIFYCLGVLVLDVFDFLRLPSSSYFSNGLPWILIISFNVL